MSMHVRSSDCLNRHTSVAFAQALSSHLRPRGVSMSEAKQTQLIVTNSTPLPRWEDSWLGGHLPPGVMLARFTDRGVGIKKPHVFTWRGHQWWTCGSLLARLPFDHSTFR